MTEDEIKAQDHVALRDRIFAGKVTEMSMKEAVQRLLAVIASKGQTIEGPIASQAITCYFQSINNTDGLHASLVRHAVAVIDYAWGLSFSTIRSEVRHGNSSVPNDAWGGHFLPSQLISRWRRPAPDYKQPISLVFLEDRDAISQRKLNSKLPPDREVFPLLPYWRFPVPDDGHCLSRAVLGGNLNGVPCEKLRDLRKAWRELPRDGTSGVVLESSRDVETKLLGRYRKLSVFMPQQLQPPRTACCMVAHDLSL
jgi:hypothetical protein